MLEKLDAIDWLESFMLGEMGVLLTIGYIVAIISAVALRYYTYCVPQEKIAKKLGIRGWLAYLPVARNIQRMRISDLPMWQLFFVGTYFTWTLAFVAIWLLTLLFLSINSVLAIIMCVLMVIGYVAMWCLTTYRYYSRIVTKFGFDRAMAIVLMFVPVVNQAVLYFMALSDKYQPTGRGAVDSGLTEMVKRPTPAPQAGSSAPAGLEGVAGMYTGAKFNMASGEEFVIGRDGALSNIIISANSEKVSRRHCAVKYNATMGCYEVTDYSMNGTFYGNTRLVKDQVTRVQRGTVLVIGDKLNQFKLL